jgi:elongation factor P
MNIPIKKGMLLRHQDHLYFVEDFHERHSGKQKPTVHVRLRDVRDGRHVERSLDDLMPIEEVDFTYRMLQYTYSSRPGAFVFMDCQTFDEFELSASHLHGFEPFLTEGLEVRAMFVDGKPVMLDLPASVLLRVKSTAAPQPSVGQGGSVLKEATLENGLAIRVPLFIKNGDLIRVNTRDRTYAGKEKDSG